MKQMMSRYDGEGVDFYEEKRLLLICLYDFASNDVFSFGECLGKGKTKVVCKE